MAGRQRDDQVAVNGGARASCHDQAAVAERANPVNGALDLASVAQVDGLNSIPSEAPRPGWRRTDRSRQECRYLGGSPHA